MIKVMVYLRTAIIVAREGKGMVPVFGIPTIRRLVLLVLQMGFETIEIMGGVNPLRPVLSDLLPPEAFHQVGDPEDFDRVVSKLALSETESVLVLKANHVVDQFSLGRLKEAAAGPDIYCLGGTETANTDPIYVASPADIVRLLHALWSPDESNLKMLGPAHYVEGTSGLPCAIGQERDQTEILEARLVAALAFQTRERDGFLARHIDRRVSRFFSKRLARTHVTPNQITFFSATIGLAGAFLLSRPGYWLPLIGSLFFLLFAVADGVDGEVSRLRLQSSQFGYYLDMISDNVVNVSIFLGIALGLYHDTADRIYLKALLLLIGGFGLCALSVYYNILRRSQDELSQSSRRIRFMTLLINSDFAYLVVASAFVRRLNWFLIATSIGTYLFAGTLWAMSLHEKRRLRIGLQ